jgi:hypothetical protein
MSLNDFNDTASADISISVSGSGQFSPFYGQSYPLNWTLSGDIYGEQFTDNRNIKQKTCGTGLYTDKKYTTFNARGSVGNTSGAITSGRVSRVYSPETIAGTNIGNWDVNTKPVLTNGGFADGVLSQRVNYTVALPKTQGAKIDDPITIDPPIDYVARVYPGDTVYTQVFTQGDGQKTGRWYVAPQERFPKPDRTFFWEPNENPKLEAGGIADGKLQLPGTIMLPTSDHHIANYSDSFDGMSYFYENQGVMFDGQEWTKKTVDPYVYKPEEGPEEFRNLGIGYFDREFYALLLEDLHWQKSQVITKQLIDDTNLVTLTVTPEEGEAYSTEFYFRWGSLENKEIQNGEIIYDFGDAWSKYRIANQEWLTEKKLNTCGIILWEKDAPDPENPMQIWMGALFKDGETFTTEEKIDFEGQELINTFTVTVTAKGSQK